MNEAVSPFEEPWPHDEMQLLVDAVRSAVAAPRPQPSGGSRNGAGGLSAASNGDGGAIENSLAEAGRRWARAHQSASLMRSRLDEVEASMDAELDTGTEADRAAYHRAWRIVTDAATWTSLNQLEEAALLDPLTGVGNRRAMDLMLTRAMSGARRTGSDLVVVAVDLDGLKRINDSRGHAEGDRTLTSLVDAIGEGLRTSDAVFRTGGDEFAIVLQGIGLGEVEPLMDRISAGDTPEFTWGAAAFGLEYHGSSELLDAADADLYRRRGADRGLAGAGAVGLAGAGAGAATGAAAAGAVVVDLRHPSGSLRSRVSRRVSVAVAAGLVAIGGTLAAVTTLSPGPQTALPPRHTGTTVPGPGSTSPTTTPGSSTPSSTTPSSGSTPGGNLSPFQLATQIAPSSTTTVGTTSTTSPGPTGPTGVTTPIPPGQTSPTGPTSPTSPTGPTGTTPPTTTPGAVSGLVVGLETTVNSTVFGLVSALGLGQLVATHKK